MNHKEELLYEMEGLLRSVFRQLRQGVNSILEKEISRNEFFILKALHCEGTLKASDLSKKLDVSASHITSMADSLVGKGLIERSRAESDRRIINIGITDAGTKKLMELEKKKTEYLFERFESLNQEELQTLVHLFKKLDTDLD
ncbi:MarR family transcriptional regulator [Metabacillus sp. KIGAM252]|uniref:MarR family transcriptional regulator n=1 Tax=Metabacillus flavus TaxID=2823519 RepID=A0ABS5LEX7_9BACI|nr:MarR family transcriptional regulator [Metabacillus flavus]MBS2969297.1 MarR family transcriptional regulator [Metabacillus flavus]